VESARKHIGPFEARVLGLLCRHDATVRELLESGAVNAAYTTVMTTLDRLFKKGFVDRTLVPGSRAFRYRLRSGERHFYDAVLGSDLTRILDSSADPSLPISFLVDAVAKHDTALLDELQRAVNRKRNELRRRQKP